jgi:hypothetical protein
LNIIGVDTGVSANNENASRARLKIILGTQGGTMEGVRLRKHIGDIHADAVLGVHQHVKVNQPNLIGSIGGIG